MKRVIRYSFFVLLGGFPFVCQGQVLDFRNGSVETKEGVSMTGKIGYNLVFPNTNYIKFKSPSPSSQTKVSLHSIKRFSVNGQEYRTLSNIGNSGLYRAGLVIATGEIVVIEMQKKYFLIYEDSTYFLDNSKKEKEVGGKIKVTKSGLYMVTLNKLFKDCRLNYSRISLKLNQKTLIQFLDSAAQCKNLQFAPTRKPTRWSVGVTGGAGTSTFQSKEFLRGTRSNSMRFSTLGLTITRDVFGVNKLKLRIDANFRNNQFKGSKVWENFNPYRPLAPLRASKKTELANYEMSYSYIEVPMGFQYYLFKSKFGVYLNLGIMMYSPINTTLNVNAFELLNDEYIPRYQYQIDTRSNNTPISGYWGGGGFEFDLLKRLSSFIELRYEENESVKVATPNVGNLVADLKFEELSCRFGIKLNL